VFLINPNGITIGKDAIINTNGFTASTLDISNENIKARNFTFEQTKDKALAEIVNHGLITVGKDGSVNLIGGNVKNKGVISVNGGNISLLAGQKITISDIANPTITYSIAAPENEAVNLGEIFAKGGNINIRAANIRNQGKLSADSVSKDKSGNIILSAKEGEAEIGGVISAQNQQAKGGKLMITGDKVTLKTGAVIDLSGKEGGETYLGGDERGEGKNGIQLAKKTTLEKGSTINVSGKEKGGRAIVWGDIALIDGNINARGSDIAKTGGFVETSGHYLSIGNDAAVEAKEWLLDPDNVTISNGENDESQLGNDRGDTPNKILANGRTTVNNKTLSTALSKGIGVNISATRKVNVTADIDVHNGTLTLHSEQDGVEINGNITSEKNGNLTIKAGSWVDVHKNITLGTGFLNITSGNIAFEKGNDLTITAQGNITSNKNETQLRLNNVSLNGTGAGLNFIAHQNNFTHKFDGKINISGIVTINQTTQKDVKYWLASKDSYWNVSSLTLNNNAKFTFIKFVNSASNSNNLNSPHRRFAGVHFNGVRGETNFNIGAGAKALFKLKPNAATDPKKPLPISFNANITATGSSGSSVMFDIHANLTSRAASINMDSINITGGLDFSITSHNRNSNAFEIQKDLIINATGSNFSLKQTKDSFHNEYSKHAINSSHNLTILGGNVTLGGENSSSSITGNINITNKANVTLQADTSNSNTGLKKRTLTLGNISVEGNLSLTGANANIVGNLSIAEDSTFKGEASDNLNITGTFTNNGTANINIKQGVVKLGDITNNGSLNITTNASGNQKTIINGNITNKKGNLNITNNKANAEIQIGGNISQKEGNLTISSDKVNITNRITIKAGVEEGGSSSSATNNANLTIKTKTLELTNDLNISGFNKAEITAKNGSDLTIGKASSGSGNADAKKVTFDKVKDSKISADGHNVTLNSEVETSNGGSDAGNDNSTGLTISAKDVTVNNNITSHKTINISAATGNVTTKAGTTINTTTGSVEVTAQNSTVNGNITSQNVTVTVTENLITAENAVINATSGTVNISTKTGDIKGGIKSTSGNVNITASGNTLNVSNITGQNVTVTTSSGALTTTKDSTISATTGDANITTRTGNINGKVESSSGSVTLSATGETLTVSSISGNAVTITADSGKLTSTADSKIEAKSGEANVTSATGTIGGTISGNTVNVATTGGLTTQAGSKIEAKSGEANITSATGTIGGTISGGTVNITANTGGLTIGSSAKVDATNGAATLTASSGKLTTEASSSITSAKGQVDLSARDGNIGGSINAANVTLNTTGTLTTVKGSSINANSGTLVINAEDAKLDGEASGNSTVVNATNASGSGSVTAKTSSSVNITGDLNTVNGLNIISKDGRNTVRLRGKEIEVKYIQPGVASVEEVIEAKRVLEKVKDLSDEERETLAKLGVSAVRFIEPNNTITVNTQNEFTTRPSSQVTISEGKACFSSGNGAAVCTNVADDGQQ
ncbi:TPA: beta strand repeat-containing protein, partial [Haemophilus influenzae]